VHAEVGIRCPKCSPPSKILRPRNLAAGGGVILIGLVLLTLVLAQFGGNQPAAFNEPPAIGPDEFQGVFLDPVADSPMDGQPAKLAISDAVCVRIDFLGATTCEGGVRNVSDSSLSGVLAVIELLSEDSEVQAVSRAPIAFDPILPGQESPWSLTVSYNPELDHYRVSFSDHQGRIPATWQTTAP
jgi:hypothetical protein